MLAAQTAKAAKEQRRAVRKERLQGLLENRPRTGPQTVHFDIANACNTRCTTCWHHSPFLDDAHRPGPAWKRLQMSFDTFRAILDDLVALGGLEQIILSGMGDPTLNPRLGDMVEYAHGRGIGVTIITNLLVADLPRLLASPGELQFLASICGVTEEAWQAFHAHPKPNGFGTLLDQLGVLRDRGFSPKHVQVINRQNFHELVDMVRFAETWPAARINFKLASLSHGTEAVALSRTEKVRLRRELIPAAMELAQQLDVETDLAAFATQLHLESHRTAPIEEVGCFMGFAYCRITVDNELLYCCNTNVSVGFVSEETPFRALWEGDRHNALRDTVRAGRYFRGCDQCGKYKQNLKWSEKLRASLPEPEFQRLLGRGSE